MKKITVFLIFLVLAVIGFLFWDHIRDGELPAGSLQKENYRSFDSSRIPEYRGEASVEIDGGQPAFASDEGGTEFYQNFSELDGLGRCGAAVACIDREHMPRGERGSIGMIRPSGWQIAKYDFIDNGGYLYNRCHLIGWQLTGVNDDERNLITGTRYMNVDGMLPYENQVADYVRSTGKHVLYRVRPIFQGKELVARGVQIEAQSVEDQGRGIQFNVFCYNVQPGVRIDYSNGDNQLDGDFQESSQLSRSRSMSQADYVLNTNTHRFHDPSCSSLQDMKDKNKRYFHGSREEAIEQGYEPCGRCRP